MLKAIIKKYHFINNFIASLFFLVIILFDVVYSINPIGIKCLDSMLSSVLQSFSNIEILSDFLLENRNIYKVNSLAKNYISFLDYYKLISESKRGNKLFYARNWINYFENKLFNKWQRNDITEIFNTLLFHLTELDLNKSIKKIKRLRLMNLLGIEIERNEYKKNKLIFSKILTEYFIKLPVASKYEDVHVVSTFNDLEDSLDSYFSKEIKLLKLPKILIIEYDRINHFNLDSNNNRILTGIKFPIDILDLENYMSQNATNSQINKYKLVSFIVQLDECSHYAAYLNNNNQWYLCDGERIKAVSLRQIEKIANNKSNNLYPCPYILIYKQSDNFFEYYMKVNHALSFSKNLLNKIKNILVKYNLNLSSKDKKRINRVNNNIKKLDLLLNKLSDLMLKFDISKSNKLNNDIVLLNEEIFDFLNEIDKELNNVYINLIN